MNPRHSIEAFWATYRGSWPACDIGGLVCSLPAVMSLVDGRNSCVACVMAIFKDTRSQWDYWAFPPHEYPDKYDVAKGDD